MQYYVVSLNWSVVIRQFIHAATIYLFIYFLVRRWAWRRLPHKFTVQSVIGLSQTDFTMSSPKREPQGNVFTGPAITQSKRENRPDCSSDCSFDLIASQPRLLSRQSLIATPAFKREPSPFRALSFRTLSPPQNDLSVVKLPQLVSQMGTGLAVRETVWNEGPRFVTPVKETCQPSSVGHFR